MKCPNCHAEVRIGVTKCRTCGFDLTAKPDEGRAATVRQTQRTNIKDDIALILRDYLPDQPAQKPTPTFDEEHSVAANMFKALFNRVVSVHTESGQGSGFFLPNGLIGTNAHVITDGTDEVADRVVVKHLGKTYPVQVLRADIQQDTAILKLIGDKPENFEDCLNELGDSHDLMPGDDLISIGNSLGYGLTFNRFNVKDYVKKHPHFPKYREILLLNATSQHGNSGGPIYNRKGEVIGLLTGSPMTPENVYLGMGEDVLPVMLLGPEPGVSIAVTIETLMLLTK